MTESIFFDGQTSLEIVAMLKALADPNRLRIFDMLLQGDSCNCEMKEQLGLAPNLLSHHLRVLKKVGLVQDRRDVIDGRWIYYTVKGEAVTQWHEWFGHFLNPARIQERPILCGPEGEQPFTANSQQLMKPVGERS